MDIQMIIIISVIVIIIVILLFKFFANKNVNKINTETSSGNILTKSDERNSNDKNIKKTKLYYVKYRGIVRLGIDFKAIDITVDDDKKTILLKVPNATIIDCNVESGSMDPLYIDANEKKKSETNFLKNGYDACCNDMNEKISRDDEMLKIAKKNAVSAIKGLVIPLVEQINKEYKVEIIEENTDE